MPEPLNLDLGLPNQDSSNSSQSDSSQDTYGSQFLNNVDPNDRPYVEKYIKDWDAGVTQKFQEYSEKLKPYEDLGVDFDSVQAAIGVMKMAEADPVGFFNSIKEQLTEMGLLGDDNEGGSNTPGAAGTQTNLPEFEGLPPQFVGQFQQMQKQLDELARYKQANEAEREKQNTQQQLDNLLKDLENKHGKFDEHAVLGRMLNGMSPEDAVKDYMKTMQEFSSPRRNTPPPVLGGGRTAVDQVDSSKLRDKSTRKSVVADMLSGLAD